MDRSTRSDLLILGAGLAGVVAAAIMKSMRQSGTDEAGPQPASVPLPELLATVTVVRRGGKMAGLYPDQTALLGLAALVVGTAIGLASGRVRGFLPKTG